MGAKEAQSASNTQAIDVLDVISRVATFTGGPAAQDLRDAGQRLERALLAAFTVKRWHAIATAAVDLDNFMDARDRLIDEHLPALRDALSAILPPQPRTEAVVASVVQAEPPAARANNPVSHEQRGRTASARNLIVTKAVSCERMLALLDSGRPIVGDREFFERCIEDFSAAAFRAAPDAVSKAGRS